MGTVAIVGKVLVRLIEWQILRYNSQASVFTMTERSEARESK